MLALALHSSPPYPWAWAVRAPKTSPHSCILPISASISHPAQLQHCIALPMVHWLAAMLHHALLMVH